MVTFDEAFANTKQETRASIKQKLQSALYSLEGDLDDTFMGLTEQDMKAAGLIAPEITALRYVLKQLTGAAAAGGQAGAGATSGDGGWLCHAPLPAAAGAPYPGDDACVELLSHAFGERLRHCTRRVPQLVSNRKQPPVVGTHPLQGAVFVQSVGSYFKVQGLVRPTLQLLHTLYHMVKHFMRPLGYGLKWEEAAQLCRLISAPGMGKSTALDLLWEELRQLMEQHKDTLRQLDNGSTLPARVRNSLRKDSMLVFKMDLSDPHGLHVLASLEQSLPRKHVLAARLLFMARSAPPLPGGPPPSGYVWGLVNNIWAAVPDPTAGRNDYQPQGNNRHGNNNRKRTNETGGGGYHKAQRKDNPNGNSNGGPNSGPSGPCNYCFTVLGRPVSHANPNTAKCTNAVAALEKLLEQERSKKARPAN